MKEDKPLVSVVLCTYNQEKYLSVALDSVLSQETDFPFEIILSDDSSTDSTPMICADYAARYPDIIRYFENEHNKGLIRNYFDSIKAARGRYIADIAGDDRWSDKKKLQKQALILESDESVTLCHGGWKKFTDDGDLFRPEGFFNSEKIIKVEGDEILDDLLSHRKDRYFVHLSSAMFRRDTALNLVERYPDLFNDPSLPCEDFQLTSMLAAEGKFVYLPECLLHYRVGQVSLSSTEDSLKTVSFVCRVIKLTRAVNSHLGRSADNIRDYCRFNLQYALMQAFINEDEAARDYTEDFVKETGMPSAVSIKSRITLLLMRNRSVWRLARRLHGRIKGG